jgi:hypothetical protein
MLKNTLSQKDALLPHLKAQVKKVENEIVDISSFKKQALEVNDGLQSTQDSFCEILEIIQKQYLIINDSLQIIVDKEKELVNTRSQVSGIDDVESKFKCTRNCSALDGLNN